MNARLPDAVPTEEELHAVAGMAFLFRGLPALNFAEEAIAGALEAYAKQK